MRPPASAPASAVPARRSPARLAALALLGLALFALFIALGTWQVHRRSWKLALIARVDHRIHAPVIPAPGRSAWPRVTATRDEYLHVRVSGTFLPGAPVLVHATTQAGRGYWVMAPLQTQRGFIVIVNRGFVPQDPRTSAAAHAVTSPQARGSITGLLRITEPHGAFLHRNDPTDNRWYSRDVSAIAKELKLPAANVAPYFIDADATPNAGGWPKGGMTIIRFWNHHLAYAVTWYILAMMTLVGAAIVGRYEWRLQRPPPRS